MPQPFLTAFVCTDGNPVGAASLLDGLMVRMHVKILRTTTAPGTDISVVGVPLTMLIAKWLTTVNTKRYGSEPASRAH